MKRFIKSRGGMTGFVLLAFLILIGLAGPLLVPFRDAGRHWHDIEYWQDSPAAVPPVWVRGPWNAGKLARSGRLQGKDPVLFESEGGGGRAVWRFMLSKEAKPMRLDLILVIGGEGKRPVLVSSVGDDGAETEVARRLFEVSVGQPARLALSLDGARALTVTEYLLPGETARDSPSIVLVGQVSGLLGTDVSKRDIFTGIVLGLRWALLLGVAVSFLTVMTGIVLGISAACWGGWVDTALNRIYEFFALMPILPFLIVLSAVYKPSLWAFAGLALLFFWTKAFKPVYSMALQIREEGYIEAGKSIGAGKMRRAFVYVLPALLPYGFAVMALSVPGIIMYEAGISMLGLGDGTVVTWGQMLHDALVQGAVINRLWWWILPPGLMIALTGITFALLGRGFERVWSPDRGSRPTGAGPSRSGT